ncbi:unnamed protein product [Absidia cylindrospora]
MKTIYAHRTTKGFTMKVDEPKTPYIRYDAQNDKVLNLPDNLGYRAKLDPEDIDDFALDGGHESDRSSVSSGKKTRQVSISDDEWADSGDEEDEQAQKRHQDFAKKRAMHYNMGNVLHHPKDEADSADEEQDDNDNDNNNLNNHTSSIPPVPPLPK